MKGKVEQLEQKTTAKGAVMYSLTINGVRGISFDKHFEGSLNKEVEYEQTEKDGFTNFKFIKFVEASNDGGDVKLLILTKSLELSLKTLESAKKDVTFDNVTKGALAYKKWIIEQL